MPVEPNLRDLFGASPLRPTDGGGIDTAAVIRRSRARRIPRQVGAGGVFALAIGGIGVAGVQGVGSLGGSSSASDSAATTAESGDAGVGESGVGESGVGGQELFDAPAAQDSDEAGGIIKRAPADRINLCGGTLAEVAPSETGLELAVAFPDSPVGSSSVAGTVTLTNTGTAAVAGYTSAIPAVTLSQGGIVLWHSNGPTIQMIQDVSLAPGESLEFAASFTPVVCTVDDDLADSFADDLPAAPAGEYQVSAAADVVVGDTAELVTGPLSTVRIG